MRVVQQLFEVGQARVRAREDRDALVRRAERADLRSDRGTLGVRRREGADDRLGAVGQRRAEHLLGSAEVRDEPVGELEHLRRRAVVLLEPDDESVRVAARDVEQVLRPGAGERVDGLVVVADDAEIVTVAEPMLEQLLLQQVDVLVLVDRERAVLRAERVAHLRVLLEEPQRELEQVFEVDQALGLLPPLVLAEDTVHQVGGDRRLAALGLRPVALDGNAAVLRPLDLGREIACGAELERRRERVRDLAQRERLRGQDPPDALRCEVPQLPERRRVERSRPDALHPERGEASAQLARGLVGEGDRHDPRRLERAGRDLLGDPAGDRRRLAGARARKDADGAAHGLGRAPLLRVQAVERVHLATVPRPAAVDRHGSAKRRRHETGSAS